MAGTGRPARGPLLPLRPTAGSLLNPVQIVVGVAGTETLISENILIKISAVLSAGKWRLLPETRDLRSAPDHFSFFLRDSPPIDFEKESVSMIGFVDGD